MTYSSDFEIKVKGGTLEQWKEAFRQLGFEEGRDYEINPHLPTFEISEVVPTPMKRTPGEIFFVDWTYGTSRDRVWVEPTGEDIDKYFEGLMIEIEEPFIGKARRPGWKCKNCGWTVGSQGLPPGHWCPNVNVGVEFRWSPYKMMDERPNPHEELYIEKMVDDVIDRLTTYPTRS